MMRRISRSLLTAGLALCTFSVACMSSGQSVPERSLSENAAVADAATSAQSNFTSATLTGAAKIVSLLQLLPESEVDYSLPEHGGLIQAEYNEQWPGKPHQEPGVQVSRSWDFAPDGTDIEGPNTIHIVARERVNQGLGSILAIFLNFTSSNTLASYEDMTLRQLALALGDGGLTVESAQVDPSSYLPSESSRPTFISLSKTFESEAGYSRVEDSGLSQATDEDFEAASVGIAEAVERISSSWLSHYAATDAASADPENARQDLSGEVFYEMGICAARCDLTGSFRFEHPTWGSSTMHTLLHEDVNGVGPGEAHLVALDKSRQVAWRYDSYRFMQLDPAIPSVDSVGHLFFDFNPGRLNGVIVLAPTFNGFEDFDTLPPPDQYRTRFYGATVVDVDSDGQNEVLFDPDSCANSCTPAELAPEVYRWTGSGYERPPE